MSRMGGKFRATGAAALALALVPAALAAQSTPDFSLPGTRPTTNPRAQGPVDDDHPVIRSSPRAEPTNTPAPTVATPAPSPSPGTTRTASSASTPRPVATRQASPAPRASATPAPQPQPQASAAARSAPAPAPVPTPGIAPTSLPGPGFAAPTDLAPAPTTAPGWYWPWMAGGAAVLAGLFGLLWWRQRKSAQPLLTFEPPVVPAAEPESKLPSEPVAASIPPVRAPVSDAQAVPAAPGLAVSLEARRMNASLVATTLSYVVKLTNTTDQPLSALAVEGDMIAAHASLPTEQQIASQGQRLELRHALVSLAPGESAEFSGDFRLPLATLVPIRSGNAAYFVPLARLRVEASTPAGSALVKVQTWVVGELPEQPGAALRPFRLDLGPRTYSRVGQRAVN